MKNITKHAKSSKRKSNSLRNVYNTWLKQLKNWRNANRVSAQRNDDQRGKQIAVVENKWNKSMNPLGEPLNHKKMSAKKIV